MPRSDCLGAEIPLSLKASAIHAVGIDDEVEDVEDTPALQEAGSNADIVLEGGFSFTNVPGSLRGVRNGSKGVPRNFSVLTVRRWFCEKHICEIDTVPKRTRGA